MIHDELLLQTMSAMLPMSSSFVRQNRWEADISETLSVHMCKTDDEDSDKLIDDNDHVTELDPMDTDEDGRSMRNSYEYQDELLGGPLMPLRRDGTVDTSLAAKRKRMHRRWNRRLRELGLSMSAGKRMPEDDEVKTTGSDAAADLQPLLTAIMQNGNLDPRFRSARIRVVTAYRIDHINTHTSACRVDPESQSWIIDGIRIEE